MARSIENIYLNALPVDRAVLSRNRNPSLALKIHIIHQPLGRLLIIAKKPALPEHSIDERSLTVVYVSDYCNVTYIIIVYMLFHLLNLQIIRDCYKQFAPRIKEDYGRLPAADGGAGPPPGFRREVRLKASLPRPQSSG